jgi:hypothetical protein
MLQRVLREYFIATFPIALVMFAAVGYTLSQVIQPLSIHGWDIVLLLSLVGATSLSVLINREGIFRAADHTKQPKQSRVVAYIPYLILLPGLAAVLLSTRIQISFHGFFHSGYVYQILANHTPPENPILPGFPANIYWLYHAFLAASADLTGVAPPLLSIAVNILTLIATIILAAQLGRSQGLIRSQLLLTLGVLFMLFGENLFGILHVLLMNVLRIDLVHIILPGAPYSTAQPLTIDSYIEPMALGNGRLSNLWHKFLNFNGFPLGIMYYVWALFIAARMIKEQMRHIDIALLILAMVGGLAFHTTSGLFIVLVIPVAIFATRLTLVLADKDYYFAPKLSIVADMYQKVYSGDLRGRVLLAGALISGIPITLYVAQAARALPGSGRVQIVNLINIFSVLIAIYPVLPLFVSSTIGALRNRDRGVVFLAFTSIFGYGMACIAVLPEDNQYKFVYLASIPACLIAFLAINNLLLSVNRRSSVWGKIAITGISILLFMNLLYVGLAYMWSSWFSDRSFGYEGTHVTSDGRGYRDIFTWVRDNTLPNTLVVAPLVPKANTELFILSERLPYVADWDEFAAGIPEYDVRRNVVDDFYAAEGPIERKIAAVNYIRGFHLARPIVIIVPHQYLNTPMLERTGFKLLYRGTTGDLWLLRS